MGFYFHRIPRWVEKLFPDWTWRIPNDTHTIYLTFDDGPTPEITEFVLDCLKQKKASATFFCLGSQLQANPALGRQIVDDGHQLANHGFRHLSGWWVSGTTYLGNIEKGAREVFTVVDQFNPLFRPPFGHIRRYDEKTDRKIMWSLMSGDFDEGLSKERCLEQLKALTRPGDIIVFHDNQKAHEKLTWVLPRYLDFCIEQGFAFDRINCTND